MIKKILFTSILTITILIPQISISATNYQLLAPIPNENNAPQSELQIGDNTLRDYLKNMYRLGIIIATGLAVIMVMWGGIEYITTDAIGGKEEGKERVQNAILGLLLALGSYVILRTIDPNLVSVNLDIKEVDRAKLAELGKGAGDVFGAIEDLEPADTEPPLSGNEQSATIPNNAPVVDNAQLQSYLNCGKYRSHQWGDGNHHDGYHSPYIEYIYQYGENNFRPLKVSNTFRGPGHAQSIKNPSSDHTRGQAIDFHSGGLADDNQTFISRGNALVNWALQNGELLKIDQIIFRDKNYRWNGSRFVEGNPVSGHYNHVHIGRVDDGSQNWAPGPNCQQ